MAFIFASSFCTLPVLAQTNGDTNAPDAKAKAHPNSEAILKFSQDGNAALRDIEAARLAIFTSDPKIAIDLIKNAQAEIAKAEKAEASMSTGAAGAQGAPAKMAMIPVDGQLVVTDDFVPTKEKQAHIANANKNIGNGDHKQALKELHLGEIEIIYNRLWMPVARAEKHLDQAVELIGEQKYYEANLALKAIGGSLTIESVALTEVPKKAQTAKKAE
ncbi:MAG: YfdX family protein [Methylovirgula sp.]